MKSDAAQLFSWRPAAGADWEEAEDWEDVEAEVEQALGPGEVPHWALRPARIVATFGLAGAGAEPIHYVEVVAQGERRGVTIVQIARLTAGADLEPLTADLLARFDLAAAADKIRTAAIVQYLGTGLITIGHGSPWIPIPDVRRWLAGPPGTKREKPGPKPKASLEQVAKAWKAASRKGQPATRAVAEALDVSMPSARRYIAQARKAGQIKES